jgi:hypothetical protein
MKLSPFERQLVENIKKLEHRISRLEHNMTTKNNQSYYDSNSCNVCGLNFSDSSQWPHDCTNYKCPIK